MYISKIMNKIFKLNNINKKIIKFLLLLFITKSYSSTLPNIEIFFNIADINICNKTDVYQLISLYKNYTNTKSNYSTGNINQLNGRFFFLSFFKVFSCLFNYYSYSVLLFFSIFTLFFVFSLIFYCVDRKRIIKSDMFEYSYMKESREYLMILNNSRLYDKEKESKVDDKENIQIEMGNQNNQTKQIVVKSQDQHKKVEMMLFSNRKSTGDSKLIKFQKIPGFRRISESPNSRLNKEDNGIKIEEVNNLVLNQEKTENFNKEKVFNDDIYAKLRVIKEEVGINEMNNNKQVIEKEYIIPSNLPNDVFSDSSKKPSFNSKKTKQSLSLNEKYDIVSSINSSKTGRYELQDKLGYCSFVYMNILRHHLYISPFIITSPFNHRHRKILILMTTLILYICILSLLYSITTLGNDSIEGLFYTNIVVYIGYLLVTHIISNLIVYLIILFFIFSINNKKKVYKNIDSNTNISYSNKSHIEKYSKNNIRFIFGYVFILVLTLISFYFIFTFCSIWYTWDFSLFIGWFCIVISDLICLETIVECFIAVLYIKQFKMDNKFKKSRIFYWIWKIREYRSMA